MKESELDFNGLEVAVVGIACRYPDAVNYKKFWSNLINGVCSIKFHSNEELESLGYTKEILSNKNFVPCEGGALENKEFFDADFFGYLPFEAKLMDPQIRIFHEVVWEALEDAALCPSTYPGSIGLYAGGSDNFNWEFYKNYLIARNNFNKNAIQFLSKDFLTRRVSYNLNLSGPSVNIETACSTSLVAVHLACMGLISGETDVALAGGVSLSSREDYGYLYEENLINSPDGLCRAFDADAKGLIHGEGTGVVVLKLLDKAIQDRDNIYAIVKGSSVNNDGKNKVGFAAPSIIGQARAIKSAIEVSGVDPETITMVEGHGSGTSLGDPIEVEALKKAFNTNKKNYCAIGSVKTNIGHLDAAAGITGFIKAVLSVYFRHIPPTLNFKRPNPKIDFVNSPFYVNTSLKKWSNGQFPLRAGISSFGIGGTNVHIVIEEAPKISKVTTLRKNQLFLFSAKNKDSLTKNINSFKEYLINDPKENLENISYSLNIGRTDFGYRKTYIADNASDLISVIDSDSTKYSLVQTGKIDPKIVFMFPGQDTQYIDMGRELYDTIPVYRKNLDKCFSLFKKHCGKDLKNILFSENTGFNCNEINKPENSHPLLFSIEYSLAKLLIHLGIEPDYLIGNSLGEYVAACVGQAISLEDALYILTERSRMLSKLPEGFMLSVSASETRVKPLLETGSTMSAVNSTDSVVVSGNEDSIKRLKITLDKEKILYFDVKTTLAFHSEVMGPILEEYEQLMETINISEPKIPFLSSVTGEVIQSSSEISPKYWSHHMTEKVLFSKSLEKLSKKKNVVFIEMGSGSLCTFAKLHNFWNKEHKIVSLIRLQDEKINDEKYFLEKIAELWSYGLKLRKERIYENKDLFKVSLPTYSFVKNKFEVKVNPEKLIKESIKGLNTSTPKDHNEWYYTPSWIKKPLFGSKNIKQNFKKEKTLIFGNNHQFCKELGNGYYDLNPNVVFIYAGENFKLLSKNNYEINPNELKDFERLLNDLKNQNFIPERVFHLWNISGPENILDNKQLLNAQDIGLYSLMYLVKGLTNVKIESDIKIDIVSNNTQEVFKGDLKCPEKSTILAGVKIIPLEYNNISMRHIDVLIEEYQEKSETNNYNFLLEELMINSSDVNIAYRNGIRWTQTYISVDTLNFREKDLPVINNGVYIVVGGFGGMGSTMVEFFAKEYRAKIIIIAKPGFPERKKWQEWIEIEGKEHKYSKRILWISELEKNGAEIEVLSFDISNVDDANSNFEKVRMKYSKIHGVIHAAGEIDYGGFVQIRTKNKNNEIMAPKVAGTLNLYQFVRGYKPDFFVLFSSLGNMTYLNKVGQIGYNASNEFLDSFAYYCNNDKIFKAVINWCDWSDKGMAIKALTKQYGNQDRVLEENLSLLNRFGISSIYGIEVFKMVLAHRINQLILSPSDLNEEQKTISNLLSSNKQNIAEELYKHEFQFGTNNENDDNDINSGFQKMSIRDKVKHLYEDFFDQKDLNNQSDFFSLGGDSLLAMQFLDLIRSRLKVDISITNFFNYSSIEKLVEYVDSKEEKIGSFKISKAEKKEYYLATPQQKRLYIIQQIDKNNLSYNQPTIIRLNNGIDINKLEKVLNDIIKRQPSLRTYFDMINGKVVQKLVDHINYKIEVIHIKEKDRGRIINQLNENFNLNNPPLFRVKIIKYNDQSSDLFIDIHHIISDGLGNSIFTHEILQDFFDKKLSENVYSYIDYSTMVEKKIQNKDWIGQKKFWNNKFKKEIHPVDLPCDFERPLLRKKTGSVYRFEFDPGLSQKLIGKSQELNVTINVILFTFFKTLLTKLSNNEDISVGMPVLGRYNENFMNIIGMFSNTLVIRDKINMEDKLIDILYQIKNSTLDALNNQDYPYEDLINDLKIQRDYNRNPLFDHMFNFYNENIEKFTSTDVDTKMNSGIDNIEHNILYSDFDISLSAYSIQNKFKFHAIYSNELFTKSTIIRFFKYYHYIAENFFSDTEQYLKDFNIVPEKNRKQQLQLTRGEYKKIRSSINIVEIFQDQVTKNPEIIAIQSGTDSITYRALDLFSNQLANYLLRNGTKPNSIIGILVDSSIEQIICILAILKTGSAYLPLNINDPESRIKTIIRDCNIGICFSDETSNEKLRGTGCVTINNFRNISKQGHETAPIVHNIDDIAYVLYTSGSTGAPKGVLIQNKSVVNLAQGLEENIYSKYSGHLHVSLLAPFYFDASVQQIFGSLFNGHKLFIVPDKIKKDGQELANFFSKYQIEVSDGTPHHLEILLNSHVNLEEHLKGMRHFIIGGDTLQLKTVQKFYSNRKLLDCNISNVYGITECCVDSSIYTIKQSKIDQHHRIPIGSPLQNTRIYIFDRTKKIQPIGVPGEIFIGGEGLARGYINNPELTQEYFSPDPSDSNEILYKTGDYGILKVDGNIEFLGRRDSQIKIRGYRVEIEEIEKQLVKHGAIDQAVVDLKLKNTGSGLLVAFIKTLNEVTISEIKEFLAAALPSYMIPDQIYYTESIPLTPNGKVDKLKLYKQKEKLETGADQMDPRNEIEKKLVDIWSNVLDIDEISINDNFFSLGGNSLNVIEVNNRIKEEIGVQIPVAVHFQYLTPRELHDFMMNFSKESSSMNSEKQEVNIRVAKEKRAIKRKILNK